MLIAFGPLYANVKNSIADFREECKPNFLSTSLMELDKANHCGRAATKNAEFVKWLLRPRTRTETIRLPPTNKSHSRGGISSFIASHSKHSLLFLHILIRVNSKCRRRRSSSAASRLNAVAKSQFISVIHTAMGRNDMMLLSDRAAMKERTMRFKLSR